MNATDSAAGPSTAPTSGAGPGVAATGRPGPSPATIAAGDRVLAFEADTGERHLVVLDGKGARKQKGLGVVDPDRLAGASWGTQMRLGAKDVVLLRPGLADLTATLERKAQVILPKDASRILFELGVGAGLRVFESGIGSAGLTIPLAWATGPHGRVVVQELRQDFADWARDNLRRAGLLDRVEVHLGDLGLALHPTAAAAGPFDAAVLDLPEPWKAVPHLVPVLAAGATVACYTPQVSQMEETSRALTTLGFADVRQMELIERRWEVKERGSRPAFDGLGHTAFLVLGRWLGSARPPPAAVGSHSKPGS